MSRGALWVWAGWVVSSCCFGADGLPEGDNWFIQPLTSPESGFVNDLQMSETYVVWRPYSGTVYYDGTGIYELRYNGNTCSQPSVSGSSIVSVTAGGIAFHYLGYRQLFPVSAGYCGYPDVYTNLPIVRVVWEAGPGYDQTQVYLNEGTSTVCLTDNLWCFNNGKRPVVSANAVAWLSHDGNDDDVFVYKDGVTTQLTFNDVDEHDLQMADNGDMVWWSWDPEWLPSAHYYDGEHVRQLSIGYTETIVWGISDMGVLYTERTGADALSKLILHDGMRAAVLFESADWPGITVAAIGGDSIAWVGRRSWPEPLSVYFLKGQQVISWPVMNAYYDSLGIWGNRLVWMSDNGLYFGEYLGPGCANPPQMDGNGDCKVNLADFMIFAGEWLSCGYDDPSACDN